MKKGSQEKLGIIRMIYLGWWFPNLLEPHLGNRPPIWEMPI